MSCAARARASTTPVPAPSTSARSITGVAAASTEPYRYVGTSLLYLEGPVTGRHYYFEYPGAEQAIDVRDSPSLARLEVLQPASV